MDRVTVVIPTRNRWSRLSSAALPAVTSQLDVELDIVVVDDGSTDETPARLRALEAADPRVRWRGTRDARGVAAARNTGIRAAAGEWVAFLDDDDLWSPYKLVLQLEAAPPHRPRSCTRAPLSSTVMGLRSARSVHPIRTISFARSSPVISSPLDARTSWREPLSFAGSAASTSGSFSLPTWDLWLRLALAERGASTPESLVGYVTHPANMVVQTRSDVMDELTYLERKHVNVSTAYGIAFDRLWLARWVAGSNRRAGRRVRAAGVYLRAGIAHHSTADIARAGAVLGRLAVPDTLAERIHERRRRRSDGASAPAAPSWLERYRPLAFRASLREPRAGCRGDGLDLLVENARHGGLASRGRALPGRGCLVHGCALSRHPRGARQAGRLVFRRRRSRGVRSRAHVGPVSRSLAEYCWTAKPSFCRLLFDRYADMEIVIYADVDLMFFSGLAPVLEELGRSHPRRSAPFAAGSALGGCARPLQRWLLGIQER